MSPLIAASIGMPLLMALSLGLPLSCSLGSDDHSRVVTGLITLAGYPAKGIRVRLVTAEREQGCGAEGIEATTDARGTFRIAHEAPRNLLGAADDQVTLCIKEGGTWHPCWSRALGEAPPKVSFVCELTPNAAPRCEADLP